MSLIEESYLQHILTECDSYFGREEKEAKQAVTMRITEVYKILTRNIKYTFQNFSLDTIIRFMELTVEIEEKFMYAEEFVHLFFQRVTSPSQFYIRALLVKAKFIAYKGHNGEQKGEAMVNILKESIQQISKALDLIAGPSEVPKGKDSKGGADPNKAKYSFLVYNTSTCLYKITRFMLRQYWQKNFTEIYQRIYKLFEEFDEPDQNWRCQFTLILFQCLYDSEKKADAFKILDLLWERAKSKNYQNLDTLFRLRVHYSKENGALTNVIKKDIEGPDPNGWKILEVLQRMRSGAIPEAQVQKQLMGVVNQISLGVLSSNEQNTSVTLSPIMQERLGQAGRIALKFNIINIAQSITTFLGKARQPNQRAMVLNQYNKAELMIKKKVEFVDKKTGMMMSTSQIKQFEIESRKQAIRILEKVMIINKKLSNPDLIYEGAVLIWNTSLPFMCPQFRSFLAKAFDISVLLLEQIDSVDHNLRTKMHLELGKIYYGNQQMYSEFQKNILHAIKLDHSIPVSKLQFKFQPQQDPSLYHRPYERYLEAFRQKILLKAMQNMDPHPLDTVITDLSHVLQQKSETAKIDTLQKCLRTLLTIEEEQYKPDEKKLLVEEEIKEEKIKFEQKKLQLYKKKKLLAAEIAELAFEWELNDFAKKAAEFVLEDKWQAKNSIQLIVVQSKSCYYIAQILIDELVQQNFEVPLTGTVMSQTQQGQATQITEEKKQQIDQKKKKIFDMFGKGLELAESIQQFWLVFNGGIYLWNNFLHIFRNPVNDSQLHPDLGQLLKKFFEVMKNSLKEIEQKNIVYYDLDTKIQTFANIGLMNARLMENNKQTDEVVKICEALLITALSPHTRKLINSIKARVGGGKAASGKDQKKGGKDVPADNTGGYNDTFLFEIFSQLEIIQNSTNKADTQNLIKKCFESLQSWNPKDNDETELELHAELWARLSRLAVNQSNIQMLKYAIRCADYSLSLLDSNHIGSVPANRLRWYSLAEFLYSECLLKISNPETQDAQSYDKLLFGALNHAVEATHKGYKSNINALIVDGAKQVWNICSKLQESQKNRSKLIVPIKTVLYYLKEIKEDGEVDLVLLLAQLFFRAANENNECKIGEEVADMLFSLVPKNLQKSIWEAKMVFISKQNKNQLQAISNMKEADPSLQAKLWVKLARISASSKKQFAAYNKAIDILKKQNSVEIVEVLIEYAEWQLRVGGEKTTNVSSNLLLAADYLIDIEYGDQDDENDEDGDDDKGTVFSRSTRGKKSHTSKSLKSVNKSKKPSQKKGQSSNKSKAGSNVSRMNRSGRVAKTTKSKNAKSIFSQREQDLNPDNLNCIHFERLFRIHTMLSMISDNVTHRIRYAFDAKQFLLKILEISINTLNEIQQNSFKFSDKSQKQDNTVKFKFPTTLKEWVHFELSKQFTDKIKSLEDPSFMGIYSFEKPQLTFTYMRHLTKILNSYGLNLHTIPIYTIQKIFISEILENKLYAEVTDLEQIVQLRKIGYIDSEKENVTKIDIKKYVISEAEKKMENTKTQSKLVEDKSQSNIFQNSIPVNLIKPLCNHQAWHEIGKLLIEFGEISSAKTYLKQAESHFKALANDQAAGQCCIYLLWIASCEGEYSQAMEYAVSANRLCKGIENWQKLLFHSCSLLLHIKKYQDIESFASKIYQTVSDLVVGLNKQNSQKQIFESQIIQLKDILILVQLLDFQLRFNESTQQNLSNGSTVIIKAIKQLDERLMDEGLWKIKHYKLFLKIAKQIVHYYVFGRDKHGNLSASIFDKTFALLLKIQKKLFELMKYTLIGIGSEFTYNDIIKTYRKYRFLIIQAYSHKTIISLDDSFIEDNIIMRDEQKDVVMELTENEDHDKLKKFLKTLDKEINEKMKPIPTSLPPIQSSLSLLFNLRSSIPSNSYQMIEWKIMNIRCLMLKAKSMGELDSLWMDDQKSSQEDNNPNAASSLAALEEFLEENSEDLVLNFNENPQSHDLAQLLYEAFIENLGQQLSDQSFEYLSKLQHSSYNKKVLSRLRSNLSSTHRLNSYLQLMNQIQIDPQQSQKVLNSSKIFKSWNTFPKYEECLQLVPKNSVYVILQLNIDHSELYCGILANDKKDEEGKLTTIMKKIKIQKNQLVSFSILRNKFIKIKKDITYLAYSEDEKLEMLIEEKQNILKEIIHKLDFMNQWWLIHLLEILNQPKESNQPVEPEKGKKAAKDTKKKAGKDEVAAYQSPLGTTPAGFQNVTFFIDDQFQGLPFDQLTGLEGVPSIGFDSSLFYCSRKLQAQGFKAEANNSNGFGIDKGKFVSYAFKDPEISFKQISTKILSQNTNIKLQGLHSQDRIPSIGDYLKWFSENGFLQIYGSLDFLNYIKPPLLLENTGANKLRLLLIFDHVNYRKSLINKFLNLDEKSQPNSLDEENRILNTIVDLLDINLIKNNWTCNMKTNEQILLNLYKNLAKGYYLGAVSKTNQADVPQGESKPVKRLYEKLLYRFHGSPVLRL